MRTVILSCLVLVAACYQADPQLDTPDVCAAPEGGCLEGFVSTHGECGLPVSCSDFPDQCPQDGYPYGWNDCLWTGCNCYANGDQQPPPPPTPSPPACQCTTDAQAQAQGYAACDESIYVCTNSPQPPSSCGDAATCMTAPPACPAGQVPALRDGCYTGACRAIDGCDVPPACTALTHEDDCTARTDCEPLYTGLDCTDASGNACTMGDANCTCKEFDFSSCAAK